MDGMHTRLPREREPKRQVRRFLQPTLDLFTTNPDGRSWPNAHRARLVAPRYLEGLFLPGRGKHMRGIAKRVHLPEDRVRRFISQAPWNHQALQDHLAENIPEMIRDPAACLLVDEVGLVKDGNHSVGVARQYSGAAGKVDNCQVAVDLIYAVPGETNPDQKTWPLGMEIYLPNAWCQDQGRRDQVGVPDEVTFRTKPRIALDMIQRARKAGVEHGCVGADAVYGDTKDFRQQLRAWESPYALGITPSKHRVIPPDAPIEPAGSNPGPGRPSTHDRYLETVQARSPKEIADGVEDWQRIEWTQGSDGPLQACSTSHGCAWWRTPRAGTPATRSCGWSWRSGARRSRRSSAGAWTMPRRRSSCPCVISGG